MYHHLKKGYTLVEIMTVSMIVAILSSISYCGYCEVLERVHKLLGI